MDNSQKTESIRTLVDAVDRGDLVLPEFQRDFVWELTKTYDLFDSLVRDIFIGSVIYGIPSFEITVRGVDVRPRKGTGSRARIPLQSFTKKEIERRTATGNFRLVLDGQQRITSLFRALKGVDDVWFIARAPSDGLAEEHSLEGLNLEEILLEFAGKEDPARLSLRLSDIWETLERNYREAEIKDRFFSPLKFAREVDDDQKERAFDRYLLISGRIKDLFKAEKLLSYYLLNTTSAKFSLFFERSNSKGIQLNFIDILAAKLYAGFNLRKEVEQFVDENPSYELNREIVVRAISHIVSDGRDVERAYILDTLTEAHFNKYWPEVCRLYKSTLDFLFTNHFIVSQPWMPYPAMLLPLMIFLRELGGDWARMTQDQFKFITLWYWASIFAERYSLASNETIIADTRLLKQIAGGQTIRDRAFFYRLKPQIESADELVTLTRKGSALYSGVLNLVGFHAGGFPDWSSRRKLDFNAKVEDHHIFPREYVNSKWRDQPETLELIDSVVNRTLIPKLTNIQIGKKRPSEYLAILKERNAHLEESLAEHGIPAPDVLIEGLYDDEYQGFLKDRSMELFGWLREHVSAPLEEIIAALRPAEEDLLSVAKSGQPEPTP